MGKWTDIYELRFLVIATYDKMIRTVAIPPWYLRIDATWKSNIA